MKTCLWAIAAFSLACHSTPTHQASVLTVRTEASWLDLFQVAKIVELQTAPSDFIGDIQSFDYDEQRGILIGDHRIASRVWHFDLEGLQLQTFGRKGDGPFEYRQIHDCGFLDAHSIFILADLKILRFDLAGHPLAIRPLTHPALEAQVLQNQIFIRQHEGRDEAGSFLVLNSDLEDKKVVPYPKDFWQHAQVRPWDSLCVYNGHLLASDFGSLQLAEWDESPQIHAFPAIRPKLSLQKSNRQGIGNAHWFLWCGTTEKGVFLLENCLDVSLLRLGLFHPEQQQYERFDHLIFKQATPIGPAFSRIVGTWPKGLVLACNEPEQANYWYAQNGQPNRQVQNELHNPTLVFLAYQGGN